jgi:hypothetical protein
MIDLLKFKNWINKINLKNGIQIGGEVIENLLTNMVLEKKKKRKRTHIKKNIFPCFFIWEWAN